LNCKKRKPLTPDQIDRLIDRLRIGDLNKLFAYRYGGDRTTYEFPDDDAGRDDLKILVQHYGHTNPDKMWKVAKLRAPWMDSDEVLHLIEQVNFYPRKWRAEPLGRELRVTNAERRRLDLRTVAPFDMTPEKRQQDRRVRDRLRKRLRRRMVERGKPRHEYLATSRSRAKPWEAAGISRRTWYRRQVAQVGTSVSAIRLTKAVDTPVPLRMPIGRKMGGRAKASLLAEAKASRQSKRRVQSDAPATLMHTPAADKSGDQAK
jgi:hypothetical protein